LCIQGGSKVGVSEVQMYGTVQSSAMQTSSDVDANAPVSGEDSNLYWQSEMGQKQAYYQVDFDREYLVKAFEIDWQVRPKVFELKVMTFDGQWETLLRDEPKDQRTELSVRP